MQISDYVYPVLKTRYLQKDETPEGMFSRVANFMAKNEIESEKEKWASRFFSAMDSGDFMPSSPVLMNAGTDYPMLSACFVLDVPDDMAGIFQAIKDMALIQQHGGGTGFNFSKLREKGAIVRTTNGVASGVLSFLEVFNAATNIVKQGGKRRGANIAILAVDHPEIEDFINSKLTDGKLSNFNISVIITDEFMGAVERDEVWPLRSRVNGNVVKEVSARVLMQLIIKNAVNNGEPGIIFSDTINKNNPTPSLGPLTGVNPCGEVSLYDKEACNLGSINLEHFADVFRDLNVRKRFSEVIKTAVRFLDNTIDMSRFPVPEIKTTVQRTRKIGLGVSGLHAWLLLNGINYDSDEGREAAKKLIGIITNEGREYSRELALEKGTYPQLAFEPIDSPQVRNAVVTAIAPTGTISMIMGTSSSGIEPVFGYTYERRIGDEIHHVETPILRKLLKRYGVEPTDELIRQIENEGGSLARVPSLPEKLRELAKTAQEISPEGHLKMLATLQAVVDNNISKTIALPNSFNNIDLWELVWWGWTHGVRGFTVYRDGSRENQVIETTEKCPVCGEPILKEEGCKRCPSCGWSTCTV